MDMQRYWKDVRAIEASLPAGALCWICSLEDPQRQMVGGIVVSCDRLTAAKNIWARFHRAATPEEIESAKAEDLRRIAESESNARMRRSESRLQLTPEMLAAITARNRR